MPATALRATQGELVVVNFCILSMILMLKTLPSTVVCDVLSTLQCGTKRTRRGQLARSARPGGVSPESGT